MSDVWEFASREIAEYDWVISHSGNTLHAPAKFVDPSYLAYDQDGVTVCGIMSRLSIPGIFTRSGAPRCKRCCTLTGMPLGVGSPKNDDLCRPIMQHRWATFLAENEPNVNLDGTLIP